MGSLIYWLFDTVISLFSLALQCLDRRLDKITKIHFLSNKSISIST